jgi:hypothetical protein
MKLRTRCLGRDSTWLAPVTPRWLGHELQAGHDTEDFDGVIDVGATVDGGDLFTRPLDDARLYNLGARRVND